MDSLDRLAMAYLALRGLQCAGCLVVAGLAVRQLRAARGRELPATASRGVALGAALLATAALLSVVDLWDNLLVRPDDPLARSTWLWLAFDMLFPVTGLVLLRAQADRAAALERLARLAVTDGLTGLLNRRGFLDAGAARIAAAHRAGRPVALIAFDLDRFKAINDTHGHAAGDAVLRGAAEALRAGLRRGDLAGRVGGEEFAVLLDPADLPTALGTAERLRVAFAAINHPAADGRVTASFGVAVVGAPHPSPEAALEAAMAAADAALYRAKAKGRDRVEAAAPLLAEVS